MSRKKYEGSLRERTNQASREWKKRNRERVAKGIREWADKNKERRAAYARARRKIGKIKDRINEAQAKKRRDPQWIFEKKPAITSYLKKWQKENRGYMRAKGQERRALMKKAVSGDLQVIERWFKKWRHRSQVRCYWCLGLFHPDDCHGDHITPFKHGGKHSIENMCIACADCNHRKQSKRMEKWNGEILQPILL